jgi:hypothetical protein
MLLKLLMKKPMLTLGIMMMATVALQSQGIINLSFFRSKLKPTSCRAALVRLERQVPATWKVYCEDNNLAVEIKELGKPGDPKEVRVFLYRQLANHMVELAKLSQVDILEKVFIVRVKLMHPQLEINAVSEGRYVAKLATIHSPEFLKDHFQQTVQVKETPK